MRKSKAPWLVVGLAAAVTACGDDAGSSDVDAAVDAADVPGTDHTYVISRMQVPTTSNEVVAFGFDLDGLPNDGEGGVDNQFGGLFMMATAAVPGFDLAVTVDHAVDDGTVLQLVNLKATDLQSAPIASMTSYFGDRATAMPLPCVDLNDQVCRHHLDGSGVFTLEAGAPTDARADGPIAAGVFTGGPGSLVVRLSLGGAPLELRLHQARAELHATPTGLTIGSKLGGGIKRADLESQFYPAFGAAASAAIAADCPAPGSPPGCNCVAGSPGQRLLGLFEQPATADCVVSPAEVTAVLDGLVPSDLDLFDASDAPGTDGTLDSVSFGLGVQGVLASFPVP